ncbi:MAG: hypothetical protein AAF193_08625, partial [Bacteroidota bacterium]
AITQKTLDLIPLFVDILIWSHEYGQDLALPAEFVEKLKKDRTAMIGAISKAIGTDSFSGNKRDS